MKNKKTKTFEEKKNITPAKGPSGRRSLQAMPSLPRASPFSLALPFAACRLPRTSRSWLQPLPHPEPAVWALDLAFSSGRPHHAPRCSGRPHLPPATCGSGQPRPSIQLQHHRSPRAAAASRACPRVLRSGSPAAARGRQEKEREEDKIEMRG